MRWWVRRKNVLLVICVLVLCVLLQLKDALALRSPIDVLCYRTWKDHFVAYPYLRQNGFEPHTLR